MLLEHATRWIRAAQANAGGSIRGDSRAARRFGHGLLVGLLVWLAPVAFAPAQDFEFLPTKPVPEHASPWMEATKPDIRTSLLWKFATAADRDRATAAVLEQGTLDDLLEDDDAPAPIAGGQSASRDTEVPPRLVGKARLADDAGRFGGGLAVDGTGYAEGTADLPGLVAKEGGFTIDGWFRPAESAPADKPQTLLAIPDRDGRPLLAVVLASATSAVLSVAGRPALAGAGRSLDEGRAQPHR